MSHFDESFALFRMKSISLFRIILIFTCDFLRVADIFLIDIMFRKYLVDIF